MSDSESAEDKELRATVTQALQSGLETEIWPRAETSEMVNELIGRLSVKPTPGVIEKLKISGFTDYTIEADEIEQPCETSMYYLTHRRFCNLPELMLPVEPEWSCRLWRI